MIENIIIPKVMRNGCQAKVLLELKTRPPRYPLSSSSPFEYKYIKTALVMAKITLVTPSHVFVVFDEPAIDLYVIILIG